ncbi:hypothetical protein DY000_02055314 [Brassica cretica]|uniref:Uncharacterized protein n=1 Tax=Brassica cretica TaxID=69181 RepID=A0ABQ7AD73_BRACR|nr:hypothetical protein DY000_02055314 [Brassica cretica]
MIVLARKSGGLELRGLRGFGFGFGFGFFCVCQDVKKAIGMGDGNRVAGSGLCLLYTAQYCNTSEDTLCRYMPPYLCNVTHKHCFGDMTTDELFRLSKLLEPPNLTEMCFPAAMVPPHSDHVGTITSTTFGNSDVPGVMRTLWRCHTVVWDAPYGFDRIHFSPWEVTPSQEQPQPPHTLHLFP